MSIKGKSDELPIKVFSKVKPSTFHIFTVWSADAVARYLAGIKLETIKLKIHQEKWEKKVGEKNCREYNKEKQKNGKIK